jgi:hypothetical protein
MEIKTPSPIAWVEEHMHGYTWQSCVDPPTFPIEPTGIAAELHLQICLDNSCDSWVPDQPPPPLPRDILLHTASTDTLLPSWFNFHCLFFSMVQGNKGKKFANTPLFCLKF